MKPWMQFRPVTAGCLWKRITHGLRKPSLLLTSEDFALVSYFQHENARPLGQE